ncbi:FtsW/RodA/SpoVE family cell cycle protein [Nesterenkonia pannonica]|nr:FtsW/RodA/SpoVE family cell cycle protein [Nesterenkonia pannonica]
MPAPTETYRPRRNIELLLLLIALIIGVGAQLLVGLSMDQSLEDTHYWVTGGLYAAMALGFHVVLRLRAKYADPFILPIVVTLNGLGIAMIHRLDLTPNYADVATRQLGWTAVSMLAAVLLLWFLKDHRRLRQVTYISLLASVVLLMMPMLPGIGMELNGARVWVNLGIATFQPGELAKVTLAIFFAGFLANNRDLILLAGKKIGPLSLPRVRDLAPLFIAWLAALGVLIMQNDLGTALMFFGLFVAVIYVATSRISWILIGGGFIVAGAALAFMYVPHAQQRLQIWLDPFNQEIYERQYGGSHQVVQGLFGLANGGLTGTGLGSGSPQMAPLANSDMIPAAFGEELGFIGLAAMLMLYLLLFSRYMRA